jgi:hypothetical protein
VKPGGGARVVLPLALLAGCVGAPAARTAPPEPAPPASTTAGERNVAFPTQVSQGSLVFGRVPQGSVVEYAGRSLRITPYGTVVLGVGRDETGPLRVSVRHANGVSQPVSIAVTPRDWPVERVDGVPPTTVDPPPEIAERIRLEQERVATVRLRDDARIDFAKPFTWPVQGRISGRFGNQRVYNGSPRAPHSGMDIAAAQGTPVLAPAGGVVSFADAGLYLTGGTVVLDHGHGVSSNFLHLSRIDVQVGQRVAQGDPIGAVGATGRATGPHLHWGMNWFNVRIDPLLVLERNPESAR